MIKSMFSIFSLCIVLAMHSICQADLVLDPADKLLQRASENRQQLRDVILSIQQQLPEMRDQKTFEQYYFILGQLDQLSKDFSLDDIYPNAVQSLGKKMALFSIKWINLSQMDIVKSSYYFKWFDVDAFNNLLATTNYQLLSYTGTEIEKYNLIALNAEYIINGEEKFLQKRADLMLGYRELVTQIAVTLINNKNISDDQKIEWFNKIYTPNGMSLILDIIQKDIYELTKNNFSSYPTIIKKLQFIITKIYNLPNSKPLWLIDRSSDLVIELIKKIFENSIPASSEELDFFISHLSIRALQTLSFVLTTTPEPQIVNNPQIFESMVQLLLPQLQKFNLNTDVRNFTLFSEKALSALKIRSMNFEGTYQLTDEAGQSKWLFTILATKPLDVAAALVDESWLSYRNFFNIKYDAKKNVFTAHFTQLDLDTNTGKSVIQFQIENQKIKIIDENTTPDLRILTGTIKEPAQAVNFNDVIENFETKRFTGELKFKFGDKPEKVTLSIQSSGLVVTARLQDENDVLYDFNAGYVSQGGSVVLSTGYNGKTTWSQLRGQIINDEFIGYIIVAGRGINTNKFTLKLNQTKKDF